MVRFLKILTRVLYGGSDEKTDPIKRAAFSIDWDTAPMASVRMGFNDFVEMLQDVSGDELEALDEILGQNNAFTLTQARDSGFRRATQLMTFSTLKNETDVYLLKGIVDSSDTRFTEAQLLKMEQLLGTYQEK